MKSLRMLFILALVWNCSVVAMEPAQKEIGIISVALPFVTQSAKAFIDFVQHRNFDDTAKSQLKILYEQHPHANFLQRYSAQNLETNLAFTKILVADGHLLKLESGLVHTLRQWERVAIIWGFFASAKKNDALELKTLAAKKFSPEMYNFLQFMYLHRDELYQEVNDACLKLSRVSETERTEFIGGLINSGETGTGTHLLEKFFAFIPLGTPRDGMLNSQKPVLEFEKALRGFNAESAIANIEGILDEIACDIYHEAIEKGVFSFRLQMMAESHDTKPKKKGGNTPRGESKSRSRLNLFSLFK